MDINRELLSKKEAAKYLKVHPSTIDNWRRKGLIKVYKAPGARIALFKKSELFGMLESN